MKKLTTLAIVLTSFVIFTPAAQAGPTELARCLETKLDFVKGTDFVIRRTGGRKRAGVKIGRRTKVVLANAVLKSPALMTKVKAWCPAGM